MKLKTIPFLWLATLVGLALQLGGCSGGVAPTGPVNVSASDMAKSQVFRANQFLDKIQNVPPDERQMVADVPTTAKSLYDAYQSDPATKKRIDDLGIKVKASAPTRGPRHG